MKITKKLKEKIKKIKLVILDVDGVLTNGKIIYNSSGNDTKEFNVKDGFGVRLLTRAGIKSVLLTARTSKVLERRAHDMGVEAVHDNALEKLPVYKKITSKFNLKDDEVCFMADDLVDLPVLKKVGFSASPSDALEDIKKRSDYVAKNKGGHGAVRELAELILKVQNKWDEVTKRYYQ
jgi:3-deoxy-D-manno-octulosonate 8-phosphate phosphatase (KDO 8-P phosphatase)